MKLSLTLSLLCASVSLCMAAPLPMPSGKAELLPEKGVKPEAVRKFLPQIKGNQIISGNKQLDLNSNGQMVLNADGDSIAKLFFFFTGNNEHTGKTEWIEAGGRGYENQSTFRRKENQFIYEGFLKLGNVTWKQYHQTVELLPDGLIQVDCEWFACPDPKIKLESHSFFIVSPRKIMDGKTVSANAGKELKSPEKGGKQRITSVLNNGFISIFRGPELSLVFFDDDPFKQFSITGKCPEDLKGISVFAFPKEIRASLQDRKTERKLRFFLDLRTGVSHSKNGDLRGGIDFKKIENLEMPDKSSKNLFRNPSFEQGFHEFFVYHHGYDFPKGIWESEPFRIDDKEKLFGMNSLRIQTLADKDTDFRSLRKSANLSSSPVVLSAGTYTCSFYAKGDTPGQALNVWIGRYREGSYYGNIQNGTISVYPGKEWKRYSFTFSRPFSEPMSINMNATSPTKQGFVRVDGLQLEEGGSATPFETKIIEGKLLTSQTDNFISAKEKINAGMRLSTKPGTKGTASVSVKNFFNETLYQGNIPFRADSQGIAEIKLPLDGKIGKGLFMLRTEYRTSDGKSCYDQHRFAVVDFLENKHRLHGLFGNLYGGAEYTTHDFLRTLDRYRKVGIGAANHVGNDDPIVRKTYRDYGVEAPDATVVSTLYRNGREKAGFGILREKPLRVYPQTDDRKNILFRDFYQDFQGEISPEYLKKFKKAAKDYVSKHPGIPFWLFGYEVFAGFPVEWWSKTNDPEEAAMKYALHLKVLAEAVREADPNAKILQDAPCNMSSASGIKETDYLLQACRKLGVKFDIIGFHPYRYSPENPDLDADTQQVFAMLQRNGYSDKTPLYWAEMMHWGPYNIPQWGTKSSSWMGTPVTWPSQSGISYDMGWTEKLSAAWRARAWLVALKYSDRVISAQSGNTNNFSLDYLYTPRASQMVSNTLGNILGDSHFRKEVRFAPYIRAYVFEDAQKRPVAAVWCHKEGVDEGYENAPVSEADFGDSLESVLDLMNQEREFKTGKLKFPVMSAPLFFRGKPGTLSQLIHALENAMVISGEGIAPVMVSTRPESPTQMKVQMKNFLSSPFRGKFGNSSVTVPGNGISELIEPLPVPLSADKISVEALPITVTANNGSRYSFDLTFRAQLVKKIADNVTFRTIDWSSIPAIPLTNYYGKKTDPSFRVAYRVAWNQSGFFLEADVKDPQFSHREFPLTGIRWDNDCLQIYFDASCDARSRNTRGYDENDYDYAVYPNSAGTKSIVWRSRSADQQLGLGIYAPKDNTVAADIPSSFTKTKDGYIYRVFFPEKYLLPAKMKKGNAMGVGIFVANANDPNANYLKRRISGLSNTENGTDCCAKPHLWPAFLLWD